MRTCDNFATFLQSQSSISQSGIRAHICRAQVILQDKQSYSFAEAKKFIQEKSQACDYKNSTINKWHQTFHWLKKFLHWDWGEQKLKKLPCDSAPRELLSMNELYDFYKLDTSPKYNLFVKLSISTGARPSELRTLQRKEVDLERKVITLNPKKVKTKTSRLLIIKWFLVSELQEYFQENNLGREDYIFFYRDKRIPMSGRTLNYEWQRRLDILNIQKKITPYCMRHSYCTRMAARVNQLILKELVGHKRIKTTEQYFHCNEFLIKDASEKDMLFEEYLEFSTCKQKITKIKKLLFDLRKTPGVNQAKLLQAEILILDAFE